MMTVAFEQLGDGQWIAADVYRRNILRAVKQMSGHEIRTCIIAGEKDQLENGSLRALGVDQVIRFNRPRRWSGRGILNASFKYFAATDQALGRALCSQRVDVLFGSILLFKCSKVATLSWLPDFQHIHLPEMFEESERAWRDTHYFQSAKAADRVVSLSNAVKEDFNKFAPSLAHKSRVVRPVSDIPQCTYETNPLSVIKLYHLPEKFVFLSNQFWRHKNHLKVFEAVRVLKERGEAITVVCTGYPGDYRHVAYFASLWEQLSRWSIRDQVIYLGTIPREHLVQLIRQSVFLLNPSLFEGWGMSVDEARSIGKQVLVSDIPVHREQDPPKAVFFDPNDCDDLASKMVRLWRGNLPGPDWELEAEARDAITMRLQSIAEEFVAICREARE